MVMSEYIKDEVYDEINKDLHKSFEFSLNYPTNKEIVWAIFSDRELGYSSLKLRKLKQPKEHELINKIHADVKTYFRENTNKIDFSTFISTRESIDSLIIEFMDGNTDLNQYSYKHEKCDYIFLAILVMLFREAALLTYLKSHYYLAVSYNTMNKDFHSILIHKSEFTVDDFKRQLSKSNKEKANNRWSKHNQTRPEKKKQYLQIMDEQNFTTFAETAEYIKQNIETDKKPSYDTIKRWLSQASKGDFS